MTDSEKLDMLLRMVQRIADAVGEIRVTLDRMAGEKSYQGEPRSSGPHSKADNGTQWWKTWRPR